MTLILISTTDKKLNTKIYTIRFTRNEIIDLVDGLTNTRLLIKEKQTKLESNLLDILIER